MLLEHLLSRLVKRGQLTMVSAGGRQTTIGSPDPALGRVTIRLHDRWAGAAIVRDPALGAGEAYMNGRLTVDGDDIRPLINLIAANGAWDGDGRIFKPNALFRGLAELRRRQHQRNQPARSKRNVAHHYDLDDRLYDLFLDRDRQYSCAYFRGDDNDLEAAQLAKKEHIAAKLAVAAGQRVLDIGCGWGGMALFLHQAADVDVLGITLSEAQLKVARQRAAEAGVADRVRFELVDYRKLDGRFDRIVSVGMFEHVGLPQYRTFFAKARELLADDGVMLLHTIGRMGGPGMTDAWTEKYIFPGGYSPALSEIMTAVEQSRLIASDVETLRLHYARTIDAWYDRVVARRAEIEALYDPRFYRMWTFYLAGAASAFRWGDHCNYQVQLIRRRDALPITRDYMSRAESRLVAAEKLEAEPALVP